MTPEIILQIAAVLGSGVGVYVAIKADLVRAMMTAEQARKDSEEAHKRIDTHIENHHTERRRNEH